MSRLAKLLVPLAIALFGCGDTADSSVIAPLPRRGRAIALPADAGAVDARGAPVVATSVDAWTPDTDLGFHSLPTLLPGSLPSCSVDVEGALTVSWTNSQVTAFLEGNGGSAPAPANELDLECTFMGETSLYTFVLRLPGIAGPGTYVASQVELTPDCLGTSCPGDYGFEADAPSSTCVFVVDSFAPGTRGGLSASFDCASVPIDDFEDPSDTRSAIIRGSVVLPAIEPGVATPSVDAGVVQDAGPPSCTMQVSGAYSSSVLGIGEAIGGATEGGPFAGLMIDCSGSAGGVGYNLTLSDGDFLEVSGASWCTAGCTTEYLGASPCVVDVLLDEGVGGRFLATFQCEGMALPGFSSSPDAGPPETIDVAGSIDGMRVPPPVCG